MIPVCARCEGDVETDNRRWPGYCCQPCAQDDQADRDRAAADLAQHRRDAAQHRRATDARHRTLHLT